MGCDIHMIAEVRRNGKWQTVKDKVFKNPYYEYRNEEYFKDEEEFTEVPYSDRNYNLFAMLADVRNYYDEQIIPICKSKGYPEDMCKDSDEYMSHEHSASYLSLKELLDYNWELGVDANGYVDEYNFDLVLKGKQPEESCKEVYGNSVIHLDPNEMRRLINGEVDRIEGKDYYCYCTFPRLKYKQLASDFYEEVIPVLKSLIPEGGTEEDVRIVFDFDS